MQFPLFLREALPYLKAFRGKTFLIKVGGKIVQSEDFSQIIADIVTLHLLEIRVLFVFGAGPQFDEVLEEQGISSERRDGRRITTAEMIPFLQKITKQDHEKIEKLFRENGVETESIASCFHAKKNPPDSHTGEITSIDGDCIEKIFSQGKIPLCFSFIDSKNCNADEIVTALAQAISLEKVLFLTGSRGVYIQQEKHSELLHSTTPSEIRAHIEAGRIGGGMVPKTLSAAHITELGVSGVHILSGVLDGTLLREIFTKKGCGTMIVADKI